MTHKRIYRRPIKSDTLMSSGTLRLLVNITKSDQYYSVHFRDNEIYKAIRFTQALRKYTSVRDAL